MTGMIKLFCIPYAGGSAAATYSRWSRLLPNGIKVVPMEFAGHGRRMTEPMADSFELVVADLLSAIEDDIRHVPYAIYGHSMGSTVAYELSKAIAAAGLPAPLALFLSGRNPPHYLYSQRNLHLLDDESFLEEIRKLGGTPDDFFKMKSLLQTFLPILRNDYRIIELYRHTLPIHITSADIVFFRSDNDAIVNKNECYTWQRYTRGSFSVHDFVGGHFFINDQAPAICHEIASTLAGTLARVTQISCA